MDLIKIYCLVDPRNNAPFYVGATNDLHRRYLQHIRDAKGNTSGETMQPHEIKWFHNLRKATTINSIIKDGYKPEIKLLFVTIDEIAGLSERFFYNYFIIEGYDLQQVAYNFYSP